MAAGKATPVVESLFECLSESVLIYPSYPGATFEAGDGGPQLLQPSRAVTAVRGEPGDLVDRSCYLASHTVSS